MPIPDRIDLVAGVSRQDDPATTGTEVVDRLMDRDDWLDANKVDDTDARLNDARAPLSHAATHKAGGGDELRLHELAAPTGAVALGSQRITGLADPSGAQDAATRAFVEQKIADLINGAPGALDTLDELAAALGDDPNAITTLTTLVGQKLAKAANLSDLADPAVARTNLGLGSVATRNVGTTPGTAAAGDDARFTDARTPTGSAGGDLVGTYPNPNIAARAVTWAKTQAISTARILGRKTAGSGDVEELTGTDVAAMLPTVAQGQAGIVPAISGTPSSSRVLSETGWKAEAAGGAVTVQDEGTPLTARTTLDFRGPGVIATDDAPNARTRISVFGPYEPVQANDDQINPVAIPQTTHWTTINQVRFGKVHLLAGETFDAMRARCMAVNTPSTLRMALYASNTYGVPVGPALGQCAQTVSTTGNLTVGFGVTNLAIASWSRSGSTVTVTTVVPHGRSTGNTVTISSTPTVDGTWTITVTGSTTFTFTHTSSGTILATATGRMLHGTTTNVVAPSTGFYFLAVAAEGGSSAFYRVSVVPVGQRESVLGSGFPQGSASVYQDYVWSSGPLPSALYAGSASTSPADMIGVGLVAVV